MKKTAKKMITIKTKMVSQFFSIGRWKLHLNCQHVYPERKIFPIKKHLNRTEHENVLRISLFSCGSGEPNKCIRQT